MYYVLWFILIHFYSSFNNYGSNLLVTFAKPDVFEKDDKTGIEKKRSLQRGIVALLILVYYSVK